MLDFSIVTRFAFHVPFPLFAFPPPIGLPDTDLQGDIEKHDLRTLLTGRVRQVLEQPDHEPARPQRVKKPPYEE